MRKITVPIILSYFIVNQLIIVIIYNFNYEINYSDWVYFAHNMLSNNNNFESISLWFSKIKFYGMKYLFGVLIEKKSEIEK